MVTRAGRGCGHRWSPGRADRHVQQGRHADPPSAVPHAEVQGPGPESATIDCPPAWAPWSRQTRGIRSERRGRALRSARGRSSLSRRSGLRPAFGTALMTSRSSGSTRTTRATGCPTPKTAWSAWIFWRSARVGKLHHDCSDHDLVSRSRTPGVRTAGLSQTGRRRIARGHQRSLPQCASMALGGVRAELLKARQALSRRQVAVPWCRGAVLPEVASRGPYGSVALSSFSPRAWFTEVGTDPRPPRCIMMVGLGTGR